MSGWGGNTNALLASADLGAWIAVRLVISSVRVTGELIMAEGRQGANAQQGSCLSEWLLAIQSAQPALPHSHPKHLQTQPGPWCEVVFKLITWARWAFSFGEGPHTPSLYMVSHQARRAAVLPGPPAQRWLWVPAGQGHGSAHRVPTAPSRHPWGALRPWVSAAARGGGWRLPAHHRVPGPAPRTPCRILPLRQVSTGMGVTFLGDQLEFFQLLLSSLPFLRAAQQPSARRSTRQVRSNCTMNASGSAAAASSPQPAAPLSSHRVWACHERWAGGTCCGTVREAPAQPQHGDVLWLGLCAGLRALLLLCRVAAVGVDWKASGWPAWLSHWCHWRE